MVQPRQFRLAQSYRQKLEAGRVQGILESPRYSGRTWTVQSLYEMLLNDHGALAVTYDAALMRSIVDELVTRNVLEPAGGP